VKQAGLTAVQLHGDESVPNSTARSFRNSPTDRGGRIFRSYGRQMFLTSPAGQTVGWDPVAAGLVEPDEAYKGKRVHKIHVAKNGDLFLETHGFRPGVISGVLLDSSTPEKRGGTGEKFDWERVQPWAGIINSISKLIVAGGLRPGNVQEAIHLLHPWGVDVSSGVESEPGKKDAEKSPRLCTSRAGDGTEERIEMATATSNHQKTPVPMGKRYPPKAATRGRLFQPDGFGAVSAPTAAAMFPKR
jgi:phosphoribosylanthranilate isomerase